MSHTSARGRDDRAIGHAALARGEDFEAWVNAANARAVVRGEVARLHHLGPPHRRTGRGGERVIITGPGGADYQGQTRDGRAIALEAKCRAGALRYAEVKPHQRADLDACARSGGVAALLYRWTTPDRRRARTLVVPWTEVPWRVVEGANGPRATSVGPEELTAWEVPSACLVDPRDARWRFYLAPLLARPRVMRVAWSAGLDGQLAVALGAMRDGRAQEVSVEAGGVRLVIAGTTGGAGR